MPQLDPLLYFLDLRNLFGTADSIYFLFLDRSIWATTTKFDSALTTRGDMLSWKQSQQICKGDLSVKFNFSITSSRGKMSSALPRK